MGKYLDIARKLEGQRVDSVGSHVENHEPVILEPMESGGQLDFIDHLTETEREYYLNLVEFMESPEHGMGLETAKPEAGRIIARNRQLLQIQQAAQDYKRYGYIKIFSTVLGEAVYLVKHKGVAERVPDQSLPVFTEKDLLELDARELPPELTKTILECKVLFGGSIAKKEK